MELKGSVALLFETIQYAQVPQAPGAGGNDPGLGNGGAVFLAGRPFQPGHLRYGAVAFPGNRGKFVVFYTSFPNSTVYLGLRDD